MYYVTMIDGNLSGWGIAERLKYMRIIECGTLEAALIVKNNAESRTNMKAVTITTEPNFKKVGHYVETGGKSEFPNFFLKSKGAK